MTEMTLLRIHPVLGKYRLPMKLYRALPEYPLLK